MPKRAANSGSFKKGNTFNRKNVPNRTTTAAKEVMQMAFDGIGGLDALMEWASFSAVNRTEFYKLWARLIPMDVTTGGEKITVTINVPPLPDGGPER